MKDYTRKVFLDEIRKRMPSFKWTVKRPALAMVWDEETKRHVSCTQAEADAVMMAAEGTSVVGRLCN